MPLSRNNYSLKLGYVPLIDSAPLLVAQHEGYFDQEDVSVNLSQEVGWATVRDKLIHGELDMASALIGLPYAIHHGVGCYKTEMSVPLILNSNGNTLTLSSDIPRAALNSPQELAEALERRKEKYGRKWTFGTVNPYSAHLILLFQWLSRNLEDYISQIDIVFIPPQLFPELLEQGMVDGFCAGEPWGSIAEHQGSGWVVTSSQELNPNHPEKVLALSKRTMNFHEKEVTAVGRALLKACEKCEEEAYRETLVKILKNCEGLQPSCDEIENILPLSSGSAFELPSHQFFGKGVNRPSSQKEEWLIKGLKNAGLFRKKMISTGQIMNSDLLF